jgi:ribonuclease PH
MIERSDGRAPNKLRPVTIETGFLDHAEGSVLITMGGTRVLCAASVENGVPRFLRNSGSGWVTAEYGMLPRSTHTRRDRRTDGRAQEIQRLIGRSLRASIDLDRLTQQTITLDCDVIQADGGTRTAAITGAWVAMAMAIEGMQRKKLLPTSPIKSNLAATSVGMIDGAPILDLDYGEDVAVSVDFNVVMLGTGQMVEVQATAEGDPFDRQQLNGLIDLAASGIDQLIAAQKAALTAWREETR